MSEEAVGHLVDHLFRRQAGRLVAALTRAFGPEHLGLAEDVVQDALLKALRQWPYRGVPEQPAAWLLRVARNLAIDRVRHVAAFEARAAEIGARVADALRSDAPAPMADLDGAPTDDQLRLVFTCCHPALPAESRVALTLKTVCGFGVSEIARAFLLEEPTVAQRLVRAKRRLREGGIPFHMPESGELSERLESVLDVLYLVFNEGYTAHRGESLVRDDLAAEAMRLTRQLVAAPTTRRPEADALLAVMCFHAARRPARIDARGDLLLLSEQDRALWDRRLIEAGFSHLQRSASGPVLTRFHAEAGIASLHAAAPTFDATEWPAILAHYDVLRRLAPSPVVDLNRAVAVAMVSGPRAGLDALRPVEDHPALRRYYLLPATRGELLRRADDHAGAARSFREALERSCSEPERRFLEARLAACDLKA